MQKIQSYCLSLQFIANAFKLRISHQKLIEKINLKQKKMKLEKKKKN